MNVVLALQWLASPYILAILLDNTTSALEIASGGVFLNTSLLSAVYYYIADLQGPRSTNLTVTAVMTGVTQLVEGAYLPDTRFCRESSKSRVFGG